MDKSANTVENRPADSAVKGGELKTFLPFTPREIEAIAAMYRIHALRKGGACEPVGNWLVKQIKRTWPRFAGIRGPHTTNVKRDWVLLSYHHPAQLCWTWAVWFKLGPTYGDWWRLWGGYSTYFYIGIKYLFRLRLHRQPSSTWMLSSAAEQRLRHICKAEEAAFRAASEAEGAAQ